ncbi:hypothetical protein ACOMHN_020487 [Nucella lapillus]
MEITAATDTTETTSAATDTTPPEARETPEATSLTIVQQNKINGQALSGWASPSSGTKASMAIMKKSKL